MCGGVGEEKEMDEMGWGRCGEGRQDMRGSGCIERHLKMGCRCGEWPLFPTQHISQHHNTLLKKVLFSAMPGLKTCDENQ